MASEGERVFIVADSEQGVRLDVYLARHIPDISRSQLQRLIDTRSIQVNGTVAKASGKTQGGDLILVAIPAPRESHIGAEQIPLDILYEDADVLVINKAKGMVVHPAPGSEDGTLVNALLAHSTDLSGIGGVLRPGIVHRLDKDTTGLLMVAKHDVAHNGLQAQIQRRTAKRKYLALVWGRPPFTEAVIDVPIGRHPTDRKRMAVTEIGRSPDARNAVTEVKVQEHLPGFTLLECSLQTGRTHQIRVHLSYAGYPIVGDTTYGGVRKAGAEIARGPALVRLNENIASLHGQALHAHSLAFDHPVSGERLQFEVPPPAEMQELLDYLRKLAREEGATA